MSWLYTIFVAGLMLSNHNDLNLPILHESEPETMVRPAGDLIEKSTQTYPLSAKGRVSLSNVNGPIYLEPWDRNEVQVDVAKVGDCQESLDRININVTSRRDHLRIVSEIKPADTPGVAEHYRHQKIEAHFRLKVPRNAVLDEIESLNGSVTVSDFSNFTKISVINGNVNARNLQGTTKLSTVNGTLHASFDELRAIAAVDLETVNGRVKLEVPSDINATIRADSVNGSIGNDFGLPVKKGKHVGRDLHGRIGTGEFRFRLTSVNGGLYITRRKDGKSPSSVIDLLDASSVEGEDVEVSSAVEVSKGELVASTVNRAVRTAEKSVKASQKEVEKLHAQTEKMKKDGLADVQIKLDDKELKKVFADGVDRAARNRLGDSMWSAQPTSVEQRIASFDVKGAPKVSVDASMCTVRVRGWDRQTVKYVLTEERVARDSGLSVTEKANESTINLKVLRSARSARPEIWGSESRYRIEVFVPRKSDLTVSTEEEIRVEGVSGKLDLDGAGGAISIRDSEGTLRLNSGGGLVRIVGFRGDLDLTTEDSEVYLEGEFTGITASASDSTVTLTMPATQNAVISTNTAIQSEGLNIVRDGDRKWRLGAGGPKYEFEFAEGQLTVRNRSNVDVN